MNGAAGVADQSSESPGVLQHSGSGPAAAAAAARRGSLLAVGASEHCLQEP